MADQEIIPLETYCSYYQVEMEFIRTLEEYGLISIRYEETKGFIQKEDVAQLERFSRLHYDLNINVPGIDALQHLLEKIRALQEETENLRNRLNIYE
jgi:chaperone modulatory protein CbpM